MTHGGGPSTTTHVEREKAHPSTLLTPTTDYYNVNRDILAQDTNDLTSDDFEPADLPQNHLLINRRHTNTIPANVPTGDLMALHAMVTAHQQRDITPDLNSLLRRHI